MAKGRKATWELSQWDSPERHTAPMPTLLVLLVSPSHLLVQVIPVPLTDKHTYPWTGNQTAVRRQHREWQRHGETKWRPSAFGLYTTKWKDDRNQLSNSRRLLHLINGGTRVHKANILSEWGNLNCVCVQQVSQSNWTPRCCSCRNTACCLENTWKRKTF